MQLFLPLLPDIPCQALFFCSKKRPRENVENEKVGKMSNVVESYYVNRKYKIISFLSWAQAVDKAVDNVENSQLSTDLTVYSTVNSRRKAGKIFAKNVLFETSSCVTET